MVDPSAIMEFLQTRDAALLGLPVAAAAESALYLAGRTHGYLGSSDMTMQELEACVEEASQPLQEEQLLYGIRHPVKAGIYTGRKARLQQRYRDEYIRYDD